MIISDDELNALIEDAEKLGYGNKELLRSRLLRMISANKNYLEYRQRKGRTGRYNESVAEDMLCLAMVIKLLSDM